MPPEIAGFEGILAVAGDIHLVVRTDETFVVRTDET
jgi:hypothetical protein